MSLVPHPEDPSKDKVKKHIADLEKKGTAQAKQQLEKEFNQHVDGKPTIVSPTTSDNIKMNKA